MFERQDRLDRLERGISRVAMNTLGILDRDREPCDCICLLVRDYGDISMKSTPRPVYNSLGRHVGLRADGSQEPSNVHDRLYNLALDLKNLQAEQLMSGWDWKSRKEILRYRGQGRGLLRNQEGRQTGARE